jgi:hypothetical protein
MQRIFQYTRQYRRGADTSAIEVDNKVVFLRDATGAERSQGFHQFDDVDAFVARSEAALEAAGFVRVEDARPPSDPYEVGQALDDVRAVAEACHLDAGDVAAAVARAPRGLHPLLVARAAARAIPGLRSALLGRGGDLWAIWFAADEIDEVVPADVDPLIAPLVADGLVFGVADLDRWIVTSGGAVWRVHPEDAHEVGTVSAFMTQQVQRALQRIDAMQHE